MKLLANGLQIEVEDTVVATLEFPGGALATVSATSTAPAGIRQRVELYGTAGAIQLEGDAVVRWDTANPRAADKEALPAAPASPFPTAGSQSPVAHAEFVRDFVEALRTGRRQMVDGREGRRSLAAVLGIYEAAGILPRPT